MRIGARFQGPPGFANGGYVAGSLAGDRAVQVTIRRPVPVEVELAFDGAELREGGEQLATVEPVDGVDVGELPRVGVEAAAEAAARTPLAEHHPFPGCFGCGPLNAAGLHCLPGPVGDGVWAVAWTPEDSSPPFVWAALDCPSSAPVVRTRQTAPHVLGRIAADVRAPVVAGEPHVVVAWALPGGEGRRKPSASALLDAEGRTIAVARATWFALTAP